MVAKWEEIASAKQAALLKAIPEQWRIPQDIVPSEDVLDVSDWPRTSGFFTQKELDITETSATDLVAKLRDRELSSQEITAAFCKRAAVGHQLVCLWRAHS